MMTRVRNLSIASIAAFTCLATILSGCGSGDAARAKEYIQAADARMALSQEIADQLNDVRAESQRLMVANDSAGMVTLEPEIQATIPTIEKSQKNIASALEDYRKVQQLEGIDKYKQYASMMLEAGLKEEEALALGRGLADIALQLIAGAKAGQHSDLTQTLKSLSGTINTVDKLEREIADLKRDATTFAHENDLF